ncbi:MAG: GNAT family N-acetyltransferase [Saprospiraceae bacterium]|nr:GNAT family N-acetyltransferase [Saprospiraceae bacterium]
MRSELQPNLQNDLIRLRPLEADDYQSLYEVAKDPLIWEQHPVKRYKPAVFEQFFRESIDSQGALIVIDQKSNAVIGSSRFRRLDYLDSAVEIGWTFLARKCWGGLYNKSLKSLMINHALANFDEVIFYIAECNIRSSKAIEKIGVIEVYDERYRSPTPNNDRAYRISRAEWERVNK